MPESGSLIQFPDLNARMRVCTCAGPMSNVHVDGNMGHSFDCPAHPRNPHEPDSMGAWSEEGIAWLPRSKYSRTQARTMYADHCGVPWIDVRVLARWSRWDPENPLAGEYDGEFWVECKKDDPGAFQTWRCE